MKKHVKYLKSLNACKPAVLEAAKFKTLQEAWDVSEKGNWMLWLLGKQANTQDISAASRLKLVFVAAQCARFALKYNSDPRVLKCIETTEAYCKGKASLEEVKTARDAAAAYDTAYAAAAAYAAADVAYDAAPAAAPVACACTAAAYDAAYATAYAANAAYDAADSAAAAYAAADVAYDAADAAYDAVAYNTAYTSVRQQLLRDCAEIVRKYYPKIKMGKYISKNN